MTESFEDYYATQVGDSDSLGLSVEERKDRNAIPKGVATTNNDEPIGLPNGSDESDLEFVPKSDEEYFLEVDPKTGERYSIPMMPCIHPNYRAGYISAMKIKARDPKMFETMILSQY